MEKKIEVGTVKPKGEPWMVFAGVSYDGNYPKGLDGKAATHRVNSIQARLIASLFVEYAEAVDRSNATDQQIEESMTERQAIERRQMFKVIDGGKSEGQTVLDNDSPEGD